MKRLFLFFLLSVTGQLLFAQVDTSLLYLRFPVVPPFSITKVPDSIKFVKDDLKRKTATIIMVFSPDCEHCQHETNELLAHIDLFKNTQIIMASPIDFAAIKKFYIDYRIADYPNIIMGRDPSYFLGTFFHIRSFPALFVYDKKGNFVKAFDGSVPVERVAQEL